MEDWKKWFNETYQKEPRPVDYVLAIVEGPNQDFRDSAARAFARIYINDDGSLDPDVGKRIPPDITMDNRPGNAFFLEWEDKVDKFFLDKNIAYQRWFEKSAPERAEYQAKALQKKRVIAVNNAAKNHPEAVVRMKELSSKWEAFEKNKLLSHAVNVSMAAKFMDELRKDPTLERYLPAKLVDNPGTKLSAPLYDEIRNFIRNEKEEYEGFFAVKGDYRKSAMNKLRMEADRDFKLRSNPEKAKQYGKALREKRMKLEKARREASQNKISSKEKVKDEPEEKITDR